MATRDATLPFDLRQGPLLRVRLITLRNDEHRIYLTAHQSVIDGITVFDIFPTELAALYESFRPGQAVTTIGALKAQFARLRLRTAQKTHRTGQGESACLLAKAAGRKPASSQLAEQGHATRSTDVPRGDARVHAARRTGAVAERTWAARRGDAVHGSACRILLVVAPLHRTRRHHHWDTVALGAQTERFSEMHRIFPQSGGPAGESLGQSLRFGQYCSARCAKSLWAPSRTMMFHSG